MTRETISPFGEQSMIPYNKLCGMYDGFFRDFTEYVPHLVKGPAEEAKGSILQIRQQMEPLTDIVHKADELFNYLDDLLTAIDQLLIAKENNESGNILLKKHSDTKRMFEKTLEKYKKFLGI